MGGEQGWPFLRLHYKQSYKSETLKYDQLAMRYLQVCTRPRVCLNRYLCVLDMCVLEMCFRSIAVQAVWLLFCTDPSVCWYQYVLYPLCFGFSVFSLMYNHHKRSCPLSA